MPTRAHTARPQLLPGLPRAWRDAATLQVGLGPTSGTVVSGLRPGDEAVVTAFDGSRTLEQLHLVAQEQGVDPQRVDTLVRLLAEAGVLVTWRDRSSDRVDLGRMSPSTHRRLVADAHAWAVAYPGAGDGTRVLADRGRRHVHVDGDGRVAAAVITTLAAAGVGQVTMGDAGPVRHADVLPAGAGAADVGAAASTALRRAIHRVRGDEQPHEAAHGQDSTTRPDLTVLVADDVLDSRRGDELVRQDVPHLPVVVSADRAVVGPLVLPGRTPCLRCLDLHRRDRDPGWPQVVAQLLSAQVRRTSGRAETASATAVAGLASLQALVHLDAHVTPVSIGRTLELTLPDGLVERRAWRLHHACGCARLPGHSTVRARAARG
jgi:hypothetical protein